MKELINNIAENKIICLAVAIGIIIVFRILASIISYVIIKMFNIRKKIDIRKNVYYKLLKSLVIVFGVYLSVMFLKDPFKINEEIMQFIMKIFKVIIILLVSKGLSDSLSSKNSFITKLQNKINQDEEKNVSIMVVKKILKVLIYIIAVIMIVAEFGYDLSGLITGLGLSGVIITLAAQDTAKNLFGGLVIFLDKPFKVGDYIQLPTCNGTVEDITFRSTKLRALDNSVLHIPNSEISSTIVINYNEMQKRRYKTNLIIELGTPLSKIEKLINDLENMLSREEKVIKESINVKFQNIESNGNEIVVIAYVDIVDYAKFLDKKERINYNIIKILQENNIQLAYNTQIIHLKNN